MPRTSITAGYQDSLRAEYSSEVDLIFLTITHADMATPIRVVNDISLPGGRSIIYERDGVQWIGTYFTLTYLNDDDNTPRGRIEVLNASQDIGLAIDALQSAPSLKIEMMKLSDFTRGTAPDDHIFSATGVTPEITADGLRIENIEWNAAIVSADISAYDFTQELWGTKATITRFPGLGW
jgi:hypothetical protein